MSRAEEESISFSGLDNTAIHIEIDDITEGQILCRRASDLVGSLTLQSNEWIKLSKLRVAVLYATCESGKLLSNGVDCPIHRQDKASIFIREARWIDWQPTVNLKLRHQILPVCVPSRTMVERLKVPCTTRLKFLASIMPPTIL